MNIEKFNIYFSVNQLTTSLLNFECCFQGINILRTGCKIKYSPEQLPEF